MQVMDNQFHSWLCLEYLSFILLKSAIGELDTPLYGGIMHAYCFPNSVFKIAYSTWALQYGISCSNHNVFHHNVGVFIFPLIKYICYTNFW